MLRTPHPTRTVAALALVLAVCVPSASRAGKVKVWHQHRPVHFEKARLKQTVVSNEGTLRLSRRLKPLAGLEATHVWDVLEDPKGNLYAATGDAGKLYRITPDGKATAVYTSDDGQVLCLALAPDGSVYAGTGPTGRIVRVDPQGQVKVVHDGLGAYVWSLAVDLKGEAVYAGTGPKGRVYRVSAEGKAGVFYASRQDHILSVAVGPDGSVYAGSDKNGLVYRIDPKGKAFVLYQAPQSEVRSLRVTDDGIYFGTSSPTRGRRSGSVASGGPEGLSSMPKKLAATPTSAKDKKVAGGDEPEERSSSKSSKEEDDKDDKGKPAPAPSGPSSGENSLYRVAADGTVREVFREKAMVLSVLGPANRRRESPGGRFLVGTGMDGQLFEVDEASRERSEIARLDHGQILCLARRKDGSIVVGTGDPGKLYVLEDKYQASGTVVSEVFDTKIVSKWGSLRWQGETPAGTKVTVAVRSGNLAEPDDTWSDWSAEQTDGDKAATLAPPARFLQYRVTLGSDDPDRTPSVRGIALRYKTTNQAPEVTKVEAPNLDAADLDSPKKLKFKWNAEDANEDTLSYAVHVRKEGWKDWVLLEDDLDKTDYEWDTTGTPSGVYRLRVVASDRKDNDDSEALAGARTSDAFVVSHAPPAVKVKVSGMDGNRAVLEATGSSELVRLTGASFAVNGKKWVSVFPADGLFDSKSETFTFKTESLRPGTYVVVLRVKDAAGNTGAADVVFTVQARDK